MAASKSEHRIAHEPYSTQQTRSESWGRILRNQRNRRGSARGNPSSRQRAVVYCGHAGMCMHGARSGPFAPIHTHPPIMSIRHCNHQKLRIIESSKEFTHKNRTTAAFIAKQRAPSIAIAQAQCAGAVASPSPSSQARVCEHAIYCNRRSISLRFTYIFVDPRVSRCGTLPGPSLFRAVWLLFRAMRCAAAAELELTPSRSHRQCARVRGAACRAAARRRSTAGGAARACKCETRASCPHPPLR